MNETSDKICMQKYEADHQKYEIFSVNMFCKTLKTPEYKCMNILFNEIVYTL